MTTGVIEVTYFDFDLHLFDLISALIFGLIGVAVGVALSFATTKVIQELADWHQKNTYKEQIEPIEQFFTVLTKKIEEATDMLMDIKSALAEVKNNVLKLRGIIDGSNNINHDAHDTMLPFIKRSGPEPVGQPSHSAKAND